METSWRELVATALRVLEDPGKPDDVREWFRRELLRLAELADSARLGSDHALAD